MTQYRLAESRPQDFGERGKVLVDLDDNRYPVPNVESPPKEQELFLRYVYS